MMKDKIRLGDIATLITKGTTPTSIGFDFEASGVNFVKIESINEDGTFIPEKFAHISDECNEKLKRSQLQENDILFSIAGAIGRTAIVTRDILPANTNQALAIIRIPNGVIDYKFLIYFLQSEEIINQANKHKQGVAQLNLSLQNISDLEISLFPTEKQNVIVSVLTKIDNLISDSVTQLQKLDQLVKSRFIELFGEIKETTKLAECCSRITDYVASGSFASIKENVKYYDVEEYAIMVKTADFANGFTKNLTYTDKHGYEFLHNSNLFGGELLLSNIGASIGKVHRVPQLNRPMTLAPNAIMIKGNELYLDDYLQYFFISHLGQRQLKEMTTATAMPKFNKTQLKEVIVPIAPMELQKQFSAFVEQTDKSKLAVQASLDKLEILKKELMQKYFSI